MAYPCLLGLPLLKKGDVLTDYYFWAQLSPALLQFYIQTGEAVEHLAQVIATESENVRREGQQPFLVDPRIELMEGFGSTKVERPMDHDVVIMKRGFFGKKREKMGIANERDTLVCAATDSNYERLDAMIGESEEGIQVAATALIIDVLPNPRGPQVVFRWDVEVVKPGAIKEKRLVLYTLDISLERLRTISLEVAPVRSIPTPGPRAERPRQPRFSAPIPVPEEFSEEEELVETEYVPHRRVPPTPPRRRP